MGVNVVSFFKERT